MTRITSQYWSQTTPVDLCMQNSVLSVRITSLYTFRPSSVFFACKTATLGPELEVPMGPSNHQWTCTCKTTYLLLDILVSMVHRPHLWIFANNTACLAPKLQVSRGLWPHLWFCACKTACLASELLVLKVPCPHLWFLHTKVRLWNRITSLCGSQTSPVVLCIQNSVLNTKIASL